jgi:LysM repeat protein
MWFGAFFICSGPKSVPSMARHLLSLCFALSGLLASAEGRLTATDYISLWKDEAIYQMVVHQVPASITLAQGMLESGNGNSRLATEGNNHFGIKCHSDWTGKTIREDDETRSECFRRYSSARESFDDHSVFLKKKRYASLFDLKITDYKGWAKGLKECGYATNPSYAQLLIRLIETHELQRYDEIGEAHILAQTVPDRHSGLASAPANTMPATKPKERKSRRGYDPDSGADITLSAQRAVSLSSNRIRFVVAKQGDTPESIAAEFEMGIWQIRKYNDLKGGDRITAGDVIYLQPKRSRGAETQHTVKGGETIRDISQQHGVRIRKICKKNSLTEDAVLKQGQVIRLR